MGRAQRFVAPAASTRTIGRGHGDAGVDAELTRAILQTRLSFTGCVAMNLSELRDAYAGQRCFILGNGPSLNKTNLALLKDEFTIGLNRIYLKFPEMGFSTNALCCVNELVLQQFGNDILAQPGLKLVNDRARRYLSPTADTVFMRSLDGVGFNTDLTTGTWYSGATVTFCAMQLAYFLGFKEVVLVGVDHSFTSSGRAHQESRSKGADVNHFDPSYFGKNVVWQFPDLIESELNYTIAREFYRINRREIVDGTVGGQLQVFRKIGGLAIDPKDEVDLSVPQSDAAASAPMPISWKRRIYEFLLNSRYRKHWLAISLVLVLLGALGILRQIILDPGLLVVAISALLVAGGLALLALRIASDWISEWSRNRRLKDGQMILQILKLVD